MLELSFSPFPEIQTERLLLRRMVIGDAQEVLNLRSNEEVMKYIDRKRAGNVEDALEWIRVIEDALDNNFGITWGMSLRDDPSRLIGSIGFWRIIKEHYRAEVGYMLHPEFWRQGIMKEALQTVIEFGFNQLHFHSIEAHINTGNHASACILTNTGFIQEAYFKEDFFFEGTFRDTAVYSRLQQKQGT
ncbi:MAG: GNAT family N-acetyltransferase [Ginsengibacter sp.]